MKGFFRMLLLCCGAALLMFTTVGAADNGVSWSLNSEGTLSLTGSGDIPAFSYSYVSFVGYSTSAPWFERRAEVKNVEIQDGITGIGTAAFAGCTNLTSVHIPSSVKTIGNAAFGKCANLSTVYFGGTRTQWNAVTVGEQNEPLESASKQYNQGCGVSESGVSFSLSSEGTLFLTGSGDIPGFSYSYVSYIGYSTEAPWFEHRSKIKSVEIQDGITGIGIAAFAGCTNLSTVYIPASVKTICKAAFGNCANLSIIFYGGTPAQWNTVTVEEDNEPQKSITVRYNQNGLSASGYPKRGRCGQSLAWTLDEDGVLTISGQGEMNRGYAPSWTDYQAQITEIKISAGVTNIANSAFRHHDKLIKVSVPYTVVSIGDYAFSNCKSLSDISLSVGLKKIGMHAFYDCSSLENISIPYGVEEIGDAAFFWSLNSVSLPKTIRKIGT